MKRKKCKKKKKEIFGSFRIPLPEKSGGWHKPKKGKGSYRRKGKYPEKYI